MPRFRPIPTLAAAALLATLLLLVSALALATTPDEPPAGDPAPTDAPEPPDEPTEADPDDDSGEAPDDDADDADDADRIRIEDVIPPRREDGSRPAIRWDELRNLLDRELQIIETIERLQFGLTDKADELKKVQWERRRVEIGLRFHSQRFAEETQALAVHRELIRTRLRALRRMERTKTLYLVFASGSYTDYLRRERLLTRLREQDQRRLEEYRRALAHFRQSRADLDRRREQLRGLEQRIYDARMEIEREKAEYAELLRRIDQERDHYERYHSELRRLSQLVGKKLTALESWDGAAWFEARKGKLGSPIRFATVGVPYGYRVHPRFGTRVLHRGITYRPSPRARGKSKLNVYAVYVGKVVYADWLPGYGLTVILDHTDGYYTLYGRLARISDDVKKGEVVQSRERIGWIGRDGSLRRAELYFELRVRGSPVNPQPWFKTR